MGLDTRVAIGTKVFSNPVGVASGTFGYGSEYEGLIDLSSVGALFAKSVTLSPRPGNDVPRLIETPAGLLNSIGLANVGIEKYISDKIPYFGSVPCPVIANVAGGTETEYLELVERLNCHTEIEGFEINLSCPNVSHGLAFGTDAESVATLTQRLRDVTDKPLIVKLTPNVTDIADIARAAEAGGADAVTCINTVVGMVIDIERKRPVLPAGTGGLSGPAIRPIGVASVYRVCQAVSIPVIGAGGICEPADAIEYLLAGAAFVQVGTGNFIDPTTVSRVLEGIIEYATRNGIARVEDFRNSLKGTGN